MSIKRIHRRFALSLPALGLGALTSGLPAVQAEAPTVYYVNVANLGARFPYTSWEHAASNIQDAVSAGTEPGRLVLVTNGVYRGGMVDDYGLSRAALTDVVLRSVNGAAVTTIDGGAVARCVTLRSNARIIGFTLTNGFAWEGGGVLADPSGVVSNCVVSGNVAAQSGGGIFGGSVWNSVLSDNFANVAGGACTSRVFSCVVTGNAAAQGSGAATESTLSHCTVTDNISGDMWGAVVNCHCTNSIILFNESVLGIEHRISTVASTFSYCCARPLPVGEGNQEIDPRLVSVSHLGADSPILAAGRPGASAGADIDGQPWAVNPSIGADQIMDPPLLGEIDIRIKAATTNCATENLIRFVARSGGPLLRSVWDFGDGTTATNAAVAWHGWRQPGSYTVRLTGFNHSHPEGVTAECRVQVAEAIHYVDVVNAHPVPPYLTWETAATNIQDAVDAGTVPGRLVLVKPGVYAQGTDPSGRARIAFNNAIVRSVAGPSVTLIDGNNEIRCAAVGPAAVLSGFGILRGSGDYGGGVQCHYLGTVTNCIILGNRAYAGGGAGGGVYYDCVFADNFAHQDGGGVSDARWVYGCALRNNYASRQGSGASTSTLRQCEIEGNSGGSSAVRCALYDCRLNGNPGGGARESRLYNCEVTGNRGGLASCTAYNCLVRGNTGASRGGGALSGVLYNCVVVDNQAETSGGGLHASSAWNSIIRSNRAPTGANHSISKLQYCCVSPAPDGGGNLDVDPGFVNAAAGDFHLQFGSPCIDAGTNLASVFWADGDGVRRVLDGDGDNGARIDLGLFEFNLRTLVPVDWLAQHNLDEHDPYVVYADPDADGSSTFQEWMAGTDPHEARSCLRLQMVLTGASIEVRFPSAVGRAYTLWSAPQVTSALGASAIWTMVPGAEGVPGTGGPLSLLEITASQPRFYRVSAFPLTRPVCSPSPP